MACWNTFACQLADASHNFAAHLADAQLQQMCICTLACGPQSTLHSLCTFRWDSAFTAVASYQPATGISDLVCCVCSPYLYFFFPTKYAPCPVLGPIGQQVGQLRQQCCPTQPLDCWRCCTSADQLAYTDLAIHSRASPSPRAAAVQPQHTLLTPAQHTLHMSLGMHKLICRPSCVGPLGRGICWQPRTLWAMRSRPPSGSRTTSPTTAP